MEIPLPRVEEIKLFRYGMQRQETPSWRINTIRAMCMVLHGRLMVSASHQQALEMSRYGMPVPVKIVLHILVTLYGCTQSRGHQIMYYLFHVVRTEKCISGILVQEVFFASIRVFLE